MTGKTKMFTWSPKGERLFCFDEKSAQYNEIKVTGQPYPALHWKKNRNVSEMLQLAHPTGMLEINKLSKEATVIFHQPTLTSTLLPGGTNVIFPDNEGMIWAGTNNGINFYNSNNKSRRLHFHYPLPPTGKAPME